MCKIKSFDPLTIEPCSEACRKCGACCREVPAVVPIKELDWLVARGARIAQKTRTAVEGCWSLPCPKLGPDGLCGDYEGRPQSCRDWPGEEVKKAYKKLGMTLILPEGCAYDSQV